MSGGSGGSSEVLGDLGEGPLLARVFSRLRNGPDTLLGPGDDAAVVRAADGRCVLTTDAVVEGRDFRADWSTGTDVGHKVAVQNLADVAAMGARPTGLLVTLVAPPQTPVQWVLDLADGLDQVCAAWDTAVVGGDLGSGQQRVVSVTAFGDLEGREPVLRSGARPGAVLAVAGQVGLSAAGLHLLGRGVLDSADPVEARVLAAHRRPWCPVDAGRRAAGAGARAMLDISDGLARDAGRMAFASDVAVRLDGDALARYTGALADLAARTGADPLEWVMAGGEDHGLLAAFDSPPPEGFAVIGRIVAPPSGDAKTSPRVFIGDVPWSGPLGWDHYRL